MIEQLENYIKASEANIVKYKAMGDDRAVKAAEGMIKSFQESIDEMNAILKM